ncbi:hypothetical protein X801_04965 [Opisthorchis viverrini]|uniref:Uncharacterized protein n=1 Tax=Opisthorchis viverrini TaxID=6198 RepID=A0A1S8WXC9_OPIVI|nr:hypothetical protein X801_04965 [Opisthorchis viverrini]
MTLDKQLDNSTGEISNARPEGPARRLKMRTSTCGNSHQHKARAVCIGVNHLALDTERIQQDELLQRVKKLEQELKDSVLTENVSETSVQLSSPKALTESVYVKKDLGGNVQSCWNYVSNLSRLTQVHIRNAAEYQQV